MLKIGVIVSTTRPARKGRIVADWFMTKLKDNAAAQFDLIDLKEINLPFLNENLSPAKGVYEHEHTKKWSELISSYDGYIFVTAEYNNGPPAPLKNAIDTLYNEWNRKPVAFVGYGGYGATRSVEQLVNIASKIGMAPLSQTFVGIIKEWESVSSDGKVDESFVMGNTDKLIDNLLWWANALKTAKAEG
jgi:NAD(P)H-dependent FMN reductase